MKKGLNLFMFLVIIGISNVFAAGIVREELGTQYDVNVSSNVIIAVSSSTYTTLEYTKMLKGVERRLFNESTTVSMRYKYGNSSNILTTGFILPPNNGIYDNTCYDIMYIQSVDAPANLSYLQVEKSI